MSALLFFFAATMVAVRADDSFGVEDQAIWVDRFNYFRSTGLPWSAGNMRRIRWSSKLATTAASTAAKCSAKTAPGVNVYQAPRSSSSIIDDAIEQWVVKTSETTLKTLTQPNTDGFGVGKGTYNSYSQVLWAATTGVGCASASCSGGEMVVCEFSPAGNDGSSAWYIHASSASNCPSGTTAFQGLCVEGDEVNTPVTPIPAGKLTYEVFPTYVQSMHAVLLDAAQAAANVPPRRVPTNRNTAGTATTTTTRPTSPSSETAPARPSGGGRPTQTRATRRPRPSAPTSPSRGERPTRTTRATRRPRPSSPSTNTNNKPTSNSNTKPPPRSSTKKPSQTTTPSPDDSSVPGKVKAGSDAGSSFTNQVSNDATKPPNTDATAASTPAPDAAPEASVSSGFSVVGIAGIIVISIVAIGAIALVVSYKKNQQRQREIMQNGGINVI